MAVVGESFSLGALQGVRPHDPRPSHLGGILAWTKLQITNGALEGMNNKVKPVSHRSYGFHNHDRYIEAIYHNCGKLPPESSV